MNKKEKEIIKVVLQDIETLEINRTKNNKYYLTLIKGNLTDLMQGLIK